MHKKTYLAVIRGDSDYSINFTDFQGLINDLGFELQRQRGSHMMYYNAALKESLNIQKDGSKAKGYQVKQLRSIIQKHNL